MIPEGFVSWDSPLRPGEDDQIAVLRDRLAVSRGVAHELARLYGESILAWRRENGFPPTLEGDDWRRFPDLAPQPGARVEAAFVDTIGWRALSIRGGMGPRRFEATVIGSATYRRAEPFGTFVQRQPIKGLHPIDDARRWSVVGWRPLPGLR